MIFANNKIKIGVFVYPGMELQDFSGPVDVFVKANRFIDNPYEILLFSEDGQAIETERNTVHIGPNFSMKTLPKVDMILIPGAPIEVVSVLSQSETIKNFLNFQKQNGAILTSVCTGAYFLAHSGLLNGHRFTTHYLDADEIAKTYPNAELVSNVRFVDSGQVLTASGITSGIDLALYIVEKFNGKSIQQQISDLMQYHYTVDQQWPGKNNH